MEAQGKNIPKTDRDLNNAAKDRKATIWAEARTKEAEGTLNAFVNKKRVAWVDTKTRGEASAGTRRRRDMSQTSGDVTVNLDGQRVARVLARRDTPQRSEVWI